jgi:hypothetical protein
MEDLIGREQLGQIHFNMKYIKIGINEIDCEDVNWIQLPQNRLQLRSSEVAVMKFGL